MRLLYNVLGPRITAVGTFGLPDTYELPRNLLDLSASKKLAAKHLELKLQVLNILAAPQVLAYRNQQGFRQTDATHYQSLGREPATKRYDTGVTFAATATYTY